MDFFTELRNTARRVERGVRDARQIAEEYNTSNEVDNAGAVVMLRKKNADMKEMKVHKANMIFSCDMSVTVEIYIGDTMVWL